MPKSYETHGGFQWVSKVVSIEGSQCGPNIFNRVSVKRAASTTAPILAFPNLKTLAKAQNNSTCVSEPLNDKVFIDLMWHVPDDTVKIQFSVNHT